MTPILEHSKILPLDAVRIAPKLTDGDMVDLARLFDLLARFDFEDKRKEKTVDQPDITSNHPP